MAARGLHAARAARACAARHGQVNQRVGVIGRDEGAGFGKASMERAVKRAVGVDKYDIGRGRKLGGQRWEIAETQFDLGIEGVERVAGREEKCGGAPASDGPGRKWKQRGRVGIGDEQDPGSGGEVGRRCADRADHIHPCAGGEGVQDRIGRGKIDGETGVVCARRIEGAAQVGIEGGREASEEKLAGRGNEIRIEMRAHPVADEFDPGALGEGLPHAAMITRFARRPRQTERQSRYNLYQQKRRTNMNVASIVQVLAGLSWLLAIGAVVFLGAAAARRGATGRVVPLVLGAIVLAVALSITSAGLVAVDEREVGIVRNPFQQQVEPKGIRPEPLAPGLHWIMPFVETVTTYPISRITYTMSSAAQEGQISGDDSIPARTKDGQQVQIDASVFYAIDPAKVVDLHITWQSRYEESVVRPVARSAIRDAVSQFGVEEIVSTKRAELELMITEDIATKLAEQNLILSDFLLRNITFSEEYAKAVEQKQIAEQQAQQAKFVVEQRKQEAEQARQVAEGLADAAVIKAEGEAKARLIQAEAEAKALDLIAAALKDNPDLLQYTYVQKLGPNVQVMLVPANSPYLFPLPDVPAASETPTSPEPTPAPTTTP